MDRLTVRDCFGIRIKGCRTYYGDEERKRAYASNAVVRLAKYEDSGLTPQEVMGLKTKQLRGRWIEKPFLLGTSNFCSLCGENYGMPHGKFNYCPNCGAKMDLKE